MNELMKMLTVISVLAAIASAIFAYVSVIQSERSNKIANEALKKSEIFFSTENRPYLNLALLGF